TFNATETTYSVERTLHGLFEAQAALTPDHVALRQSGEELTYGELNARANRLARYLQEQGVENGDNVGLITGRSFDMIIGMYGILKCGGAYVPIDPSYPLDRQQYILQNSEVSLLVADAHYPIGQASDGTNYILLAEALDLTSADTNLELGKDSHDLAYTIYTSGSTGLPKGVMIAHHSAVNLIEWVNRTFNVGSNDRLLFITSMCFDLSVYDIFGILASGGSLVIAQQEEVQDVTLLKQLMQEEQITFWDSVPTTMNYLVSELEASEASFEQHDLRLVFMSGDWIPVSLPDRLKTYFPNAEVISLGGATEGTVWSNYYPVSQVDPSWASIPYGKPIANNYFYILDEGKNLVPQGVIGELYIGGVGVALGYANDPEKTAYSYVEDPFQQS
ncbi:amino acid adenylation domain-containing protein, partial [Fulvivirga kasyanovii]|uniref:non-ribosomal peptide synthetase n=1 Tax=Fulvivirga kasyanovii TaxID=396812 RepID=UPI0031DB6DD4